MERVRWYVSMRAPGEVPGKGVALPLAHLQHTIFSTVLPFLYSQEPSDTFTHTLLPCSSPATLQTPYLLSKLFSVSSQHMCHQCCFPALPWVGFCVGLGRPMGVMWPLLIYPQGCPLERQISMTEPPSSPEWATDVQITARLVKVPTFKLAT